MPYKDKASYKAKEKLDGGPKMMKSGFKMRSGSPFQRNFGIGASPMKDLTTAERSGEEAAKLHNKNYQQTSEEQHEKDMHQIDRSGLTMKSPMKAHPSPELDRLKEDVKTFQRQHDEDNTEDSQKDLDWAKQGLEEYMSGADGGDHNK